MLLVGVPVLAYAHVVLVIYVHSTYSPGRYYIVFCRRYAVFVGDSAHRILVVPLHDNKFKIAFSVYMSETSIPFKDALHIVLECDGIALYRLSECKQSVTEIISVLELYVYLRAVLIVIVWISQPVKKVYYGQAQHMLLAIPIISVIPGSDVRILQVVVHIVRRYITDEVVVRILIILYRVPADFEERSRIIIKIQIYVYLFPGYIVWDRIIVFE